MKHLLKQIQPYKKTVIATIIAFAAFAGGYNDIKQFVSEIWQGVTPNHSLKLSRSPEGDLRVSDLITISYQAPDSGYLSLWNYDAAKDTAKVLLPVKGMKPLALNSNTQYGNLDIRIGSGSGTDLYILLWTPKKQSTHLPHRQYQSLNSFETSLKTLKAKGKVLEQRIKVPIYE